MLITGLKSICTPYGAIQSGEACEVPDDVGEDMVDSGLAVRHDPLPDTPSEDFPSEAPEAFREAVQTLASLIERDSEVSRLLDLQRQKGAESATLKSEQQDLQERLQALSSPQSRREAVLEELDEDPSDTPKPDAKATRARLSTIMSKLDDLSIMQTELKRREATARTQAFRKGMPPLMGVTNNIRANFAAARRQLRAAEAVRGDAKRTLAAYGLSDYFDIESVITAPDPTPGVYRWVGPELEVKPDPKSEPDHKPQAATLVGA
ncbi:MAG: hypothetical protein AAGH99_01150 [Planctomycetota bacterium]